MQKRFKTPYLLQQTHIILSKYRYLSKYRNEKVNTFTAEATSLKFTYTLYVFETFLRVVEMITT